jgi:virulence-associated protein VagC
MEIKRLQGESLLIKSKNETVVINPLEKDWNKFSGRVVIFTDKKKDFLGFVNDKVVIVGAGEYEVGGIEVVGINGMNGDVVYVLNVDGIKVGVLGNLSEILSEKKVEKIPEMDVLLTGVSDKGMHKLIWEWSKSWGANYVVPFGVDNQSGEMKNFLDVADREDLEEKEFIKCEKSDLPEGTELILLKTV